MNAYLLRDDKRLPLTLPEVDGAPAVAEGVVCPHCKALPLRVVGSGRHIADDDRAYHADGYCADCKEAVGLIRAEPSTLFGLHEDEAVLYGRCRVY